MRIEREWSQGEIHYFLIRSAGPDGEFNSSDDLASSIVAHLRRVSDNSESQDPLDIQIEHDRGPFNQRAEVTGR